MRHRLRWLFALSALALMVGGPTGRGRAIRGRTWRARAPKRRRVLVVSKRYADLEQLGAHPDLELVAVVLGAPETAGLANAPASFARVHFLSYGDAPSLASPDVLRSLRRVVRRERPDELWVVRNGVAQAVAGLGSLALAGTK